MNERAGKAIWNNTTANRKLNTLWKIGLGTDSMAAAGGRGCVSKENTALDAYDGRRMKTKGLKEQLEHMWEVKSSWMQIVWLSERRMMIFMCAANIWDMLLVVERRRCLQTVRPASAAPPLSPVMLPGDVTVWRMSWTEPITRSSSLRSFPLPTMHLGQLVN